MIEMRRLKNVVIFIQTILSFVLSRKITTGDKLFLGIDICLNLREDIQNHNSVT